MCINVVYWSNSFQICLRLFFQCAYVGFFFTCNRPSFLNKMHALRNYSCHIVCSMMHSLNLRSQQQDFACKQVQCQQCRDVCSTAQTIVIYKSSSFLWLSVANSLINLNVSKNCVVNSHTKSQSCRFLLESSVKFRRAMVNVSVYLVQRLLQ